jgi:hypothetical protein
MANRMVVVVRSARDDEYERVGSIDGHVWIVESAVKGAQLPYRDAKDRAAIYWVDDRPFADRRLRPIRDPGEDATDETLLWLPVPTKQTESA